MMKPVRSLCVLVLTVATNLLSAPADAGLVFNFTDGADLAALQGSNASLYSNVRNGFQAAADQYSSTFTDDITVNLTINFKDLGNSTTLGSASPNFVAGPYSTIRSLLEIDQSSVNDATAIVNLQQGSGIDFLSVSQGTETRSNLTDAWATSLLLTRANGKAIGGVNAQDTASDGAIQFNSQFAWDFDRSNGIDGGKVDFIGVAAHEIGHALGFFSGIDFIDQDLSQNHSLQINFSPLDLFRYSVASLAEANQPATGGVLDLVPGAAGSSTEHFFSIDGGLTSLALFSTGAFNGDGRQASHWKDGSDFLLDPSLAAGFQVDLTSTDILAFDVIGFDVSAVPEPGSMLATLVLAPVFLMIRRRSRKLATRVGSD